MSFPSKDPSAVLDYEFDWSNWLRTGETISGVPVVSVTPAGLTVGAPAPATSNTPKTVTVWLSGGADGQVYTVSCRITTTAGRTDERSESLPVTDR